jgi:uncharacterized protein (TIGR03086 family)
VQARELFDGAAEQLVARVAAVPAGSWDAPTPCSDWDVRALLQHVVNELRWIPPLLDGATVAEVGDRFDGDLLGDHPAGATTDAAREAIAAAGVVDPERTVHLSYGDVTAAYYLAQVGLDVFVHTWDLTRATGQDGTVPDALVAGATEAFHPDEEAAWRGAGAIADPVPTGTTATPLDQLVARMGRDPGWTARSARS